MLTRAQKVVKLREIINDQSKCTVMPCCYDGLTAKLIEALAALICALSKVPSGLGPCGL